MIKEKYKKILNDERNYKTIKNSLFNSFGAIVNNLLRVLVIYILTRFYTKEEFGLWVTITASFAVIIVGDFGITNSLRNRLSQIRHSDYENKEELQKRYFFSAFFFFCITSAIIILCVIAASSFLPLGKFFNSDSEIIVAEGRLILKILLILTALGMPLGMGIPLFYSYQEGDIAAKIGIVQGVISFLAILISTQIKASIVTVSIIYFSSMLLINTLGTWYFIHRRDWYKNLIVFEGMFKRIKELVSIGLKFLLLQLSSIILQNIATLLISAFVNVTSAADFNLTQKLYIFMLGVLQPIFNPIWGSYSESINKGDWKWCKKTLNASLVATISFFTLAILGMFFIGKYLIFILAGKQYSASWILILTIGFSVMFYSVWACATTLQNAYNKVNNMIITNIIVTGILFGLTRYIPQTNGGEVISITLMICWFVLAIFHTAEAYYLINKNMRTKCV